jgi:hypothetical protein
MASPAAATSGGGETKQTRGMHVCPLCVFMCSIDQMWCMCVCYHIVSSAFLTKLSAIGCLQESMLCGFGVGSLMWANSFYQNRGVTDTRPIGRFDVSSTYALLRQIK